jgi:DNA-binding CsgD family transcriptional regulator
MSLGGPRDALKRGPGGVYRRLLEMPGERAATALRGRSEECRALDRLLDEARNGRSSALVIRGEAGVGKTALLDYLGERASECAVARIGGVESEMSFAFAGLLQLTGSSMLENVEHLATPQRDALRRAFGLMDGPAPELFLVSLGALSLLSRVAEERTLVCLIDDAQWVDRESVSALSFVARRLAADRIAMLFALRNPSAKQELDGLPELGLGGLGDADARLLLETVAPATLDDQVRDRIVAEARGNPLALLELPRELDAADSRPPRTGRVSDQIEQMFVGRVRALPPETQRALLVAAAEPVGDPTVIREAVAALGGDPDDLLAAEDADLVELGPRLRFRHPLVRSAAYAASTPHERRRAHGALAEATDPERDPDRRAWHRAQAADGSDEAVASELEQSAARAQARGGVAAAATFLERAADLSPDASRRGERALAAARLKLQAGANDEAQRLLTVAEGSPLDEVDRAYIERLRAQIAFVRVRGGETPHLLSAAAKRLERLDPELARETHLEALWAAVGSRRFAEADGVVEAAAAVVRTGQKWVRAVDLLLAAAVARVTEGYEPARPMIARALATFRAEGFSQSLGADRIVGPRSWLACQLAMDVWDDAAWTDIAIELSRVAREQGRLAILPSALTYAAAHELFFGELGVAEQLVGEAELINAAIRGDPLTDFSIMLPAWRGERERTLELRASLIDAATARGEGFSVEVAEWAAAVLHNGRGEYAEAQAAAERAYVHDGLGFGVWVLPELIEAAVRSGDQPAAELALGRLVERSHASPSSWARGVEAAARALLAQGSEAEEHYVEAIDQLRRSGAAVAQARAELTYGEWLRREGRRVDARARLKASYTAFEAVGANAFAERARRELLATGETVRTRTDDTRGDLTPQEAQIARLASERLTNPEIAAQLYISHRTVEYHLRKVFLKLGVSSRRELGEALRPGGPR